MNEPALDKTFDPAQIEAKWYAHWETNGLFRPERPDAVPFTLVNPPPNVTGSLHIGHALDNTLQDVVIRYERLRGKDALWVVGTDHAGIATQMVVERQMEAAGDKRTNYSREAFIDKVWEWKAESGGTITGQLRRLGCSMDWSREQFTMDPHFTKAVVKVFVDLYNQGLLYRDKRLVNWDPKLKTAISDLEVETREVQGGFWHFKYPLADGVKRADGLDYIEVATTRPETMLADMAVAVNAEDPRYQLVIGNAIILPITGRRVPIVADEHADPELGSGAVKITPGHDFNDFEVGKRAGIKPADMLNMLDAEAKVVQCGGIPDEFIGLDRFDARALVVQRMKEQGFLIPHVTKDKEGGEVLHDAEPRTIQTPYGDRGGVVIEPWLTDQWYVNAAELAKAPIEAVRSGAIEIVPKSWEKTFFNWMENIQPWCVSRQLWWGHRIPAWYGYPIWGAEFPKLQPEMMGNPSTPLPTFVANDEVEALVLAERFYRENWDLTGKTFTVVVGDESGLNQDGDVVTASIRRDPDVLDTWFSSALWPFATLGWPDENAALMQRHYPNDLLISGFDILFFWCARMAMQGMHFNKGQVPWKQLYLHGLVRAADGAKMSKSKGNVVDPLLLIEQYGADALRFFMAAMESQGRDVKMDERRVEGYRNFATKLWNAARFCQSNGIGASSTLAAPAATSAVNKWIIGEVVETVAELDKAMADLRFDAAANTIYHFVWDQFCDWYIELIKGNFDDETKAVAGWVLDQILVMLHPFMPFVTEELWSKLGTRADYPLITAKWPQPGVGVDAEAKREVDWLIALIGNLRGAKNELGIAPGAKLDAYLPTPTATTCGIIERNPAAIERLARLNGIRFEPAPAGAAMQVGAGDANIVIPLEGVIDIAAEKARLEKALAASLKEAKSLEGRLSNPAFAEKAKPEAVEKARADHAHHAAEAQRLAAALARLGVSLTLATKTPGEPEIFASLQGEGASAGKPCAFIRLSRCNLACAWCDTAYTWRFTGDNRPHRDGLAFERGVNQVTLSEADAAARIAALGQPRLVITGGEPLLQGAALARMAALLPSVRIEIETNGTVAPHPSLDALVAQYNVSPKLAHSGNPADLALIPERLAAWAADPRALFKFVIATPEDLTEVLALQQAHAIPSIRIWLMPEGRDSETVRARGRWLAAICSENELNFSDRLHIHLYGDTRGT